MKTFITLALALIGLSATAAAQEEDSLSKKLANPLTAWVNVPIQINYDDDLGLEKKGSLWSINVLPVLPFQIGDDWNLIARSVVPLVKQKDLTSERKTDSGLGDILQSFFFSPIKPTEGGWIWGAGPVLLLPTATDGDLGAGQWAAGPTFLTLKQQGAWTVGVLANHLWTIAGENKVDSDRADRLTRLTSHRGSSVSLSNKISQSYIEPWVSFANKHDTTLSVSTETSYDWTASQWLVPIVLTADQLVSKGEVPVSVGLAAKYWAVSPDGGPQDWSLRLQVTFVFSK